MLYLTPTRYRAMGTGIDLSGMSDATLQSILQASSAAVNAYCHVPEGYSFHGGHVIDEEHLWNVSTQWRARPSNRVWPYMRPLLEVESLRINVTRTQYVDFTPQQIFVHHALGYLEPVAVPATMALYTSVPPWLLSAPVATVTYDYGFNESITDETLTALSGGILQGAHQFWFTDEEVILKRNGVTVSGSAYDIDYDEGTITPDTAPGTDIFEASYKHHLPYGIVAATSLITTDMLGQSNIAASGLLGLSGIKVEEVELRQSAKINFQVQPVNAAAQLHLGPYAAMFTSWR